MRHGKKFNHLSRKKGHRKALLRNLSISLIQYKRIKTTLAKAKALRKFVEPLITRAKKSKSVDTVKDSSHHIRVIYSYLQNKEAVKTLCNEVAEKVATREGGYLRILRTHFRQNDAAEMCIIEFVDFNTDALESQTKKKKRTRRTRRKKSDKVEVAATENIVPDNLTKVEGIGPKISATLQAAGLTTFAALGAASVEDVQKILNEAEGNFNRHNPGTWPKQAQLAADGKWDELNEWQDILDGGVDKTSSKEE